MRFSTTLTPIASIDMRFQHNRPPPRDPPMHTLVFQSIAVLAIAIAIGQVCIRTVGPKGFMDMPGGRRQHTLPIPRVGGITFFLSILLCTFFFNRTLPISGLDKAALAATALMGVSDDRFELRARWKALASLLIALTLAWHGLGKIPAGMNQIQLLTFTFPYSSVLAYALLTMLFWGVPQSINLIDGANGLAIGYAIIVSTVFFLQGVINCTIPIALLGLLVLNWPRPRLFLGDCGSLTLGLLFAILAQKAFSSTDPNSILWIFAYPIVDVCLVVSIRIANRENPLRGDRNHLHHHLLNMFGPKAFLRVPSLWLLAGSCACMPLVDGKWRVIPWLGLSTLCAFAVMFFIAGYKKRSLEPSSQV